MATKPLDPPKRPDSGVMFFSDRAEPGGKAPQWRGIIRVDVDGRSIVRPLAGWVKTARDGREFITLALDERADNPPPF